MTYRDTYGWGPMADGCRIYIYWGCSAYIEDETLTADGAEDRVAWFANTPVSTRNLRVVGYIGADWEFVVNFDLEPLTGRLVYSGDLPIYDSVHVWYYYYEDYEFDILTTQYKVTFPKWSADVDIFGQPRYADHNNYPHAVNFNMVLDTEVLRNLLSEAMFLGCYFLLIDKGIPEEYGIRAIEGPLWSDQQGSIYKGASYQLPIELQVQQFGGYDLELTGTITGSAGVLMTLLAMPAHGLSEGDWFEVTDTVSYNGVWYAYVADADNVNINTAPVGNEAGNWIRHPQIEWGAWER